MRLKMDESVKKDVKTNEGSRKRSRLRRGSPVSLSISRQSADCSCSAEVEPALDQVLPHTYAVCIADNKGPIRGIPADFFIKTSGTHADAALLDVLAKFSAVMFGADLLAAWKASFLPSRIGVLNDAPMTEQEMLRVIAEQRFKHIGAYEV